ncbi:MAG TPA: hypothetical protein DCZ03_00205 [Gammaproteobacteria bacterium]|nr:hypothetical protein [Gammaproteobacteria bacterium]
MVTAKTLDTSFYLNGFLSAGALYTEDRTLIIDSQVEQVTESDATLIHSAAGIQLDAILSNEVRFSAQLVGTGLEDNFNVRAEWAYGAIKLSPETTLRAGRIRLPTFIVSDFFEVGFAFPWVTPPPEIYFLSPILNLEGVDLLIQKNFEGIPIIGNVNVLIQPMFGQSVKIDALLQLPIGLDLSSVQAGGEIAPIFGARNIVIQAEDVAALNLSVQIEKVNLHFNYTEALLLFSDAPLERVILSYADTAKTVEYAFLVALLDGSYATGASDLLASTQGLSEEQIQALIGIDPTLLEFSFGNEISVSNLAPNQIDSSFSSLGFEWQDRNWMLMAEYAYRELKDFTEGGAWYLTVGHQFGPFLPHLTFAAVDAKFETSAAAFSQEQHSITVGLVFQYSDSLVLKSDFSRIEPDKVSGGIFQLGADETVDVLNVAIESIF